MEGVTPGSIRLPPARISTLPGGGYQRTHQKTGTQIWRCLYYIFRLLPYTSSAKTLTVVFIKEMTRVRYLYKYENDFNLFALPGTQRVIILNSYDVIKEALIKLGNYFSDRPQIYFITDLTKGLGELNTY